MRLSVVPIHQVYHSGFINIAASNNTFKPAVTGIKIRSHIVTPFHFSMVLFYHKTKGNINLYEKFCFLLLGVATVLIARQDADFMYRSFLLYLFA